MNEIPFMYDYQNLVRQWCQDLFALTKKSEHASFSHQSNEDFFFENAYYILDSTQ